MEIDCQSTASDEEATLPAQASEEEEIRFRRRKNTLAARRSRRRKALHLQELERLVGRLQWEREIWKKRALDLHVLGTPVNRERAAVWAAGVLPRLLTWEAFGERPDELVAPPAFEPPVKVATASPAFQVATASSHLRDSNK
ncbi:hypothetical protein R3P38DRAFT_3212989 [Favolaschia claudopus]|uniref:BZIP domain-containing protein n=1 Tax=Favolaschia claudopus TaxID=2862362 RepID=A0AAW0AF63_9AGAR